MSMGRCDDDDNDDCDGADDENDGDIFGEDDRRKILSLQPGDDDTKGKFIYSIRNEHLTMRYMIKVLVAVLRHWYIIRQV